MTWLRACFREDICLAAAEVIEARYPPPNTDRSEGLTASELHVKQRDMSVLFLCIGNHYGSRFADELFNHRTAHSGADWQAQTRFALAEAVYAVDQVRTPSISWQ